MSPSNVLSRSARVSTRDPQCAARHTHTHMSRAEKDGIRRMKWNITDMWSNSEPVEQKFEGALNIYTHFLSETWDVFPQNLEGKMPPVATWDDTHSRPSHVCSRCPASARVCDGANM